MLKRRLLAALVLIPAVIIMLFLLPLTGFVIATTAICMLAAWEWAQFTTYNTPNLRVFSAVITGILLFSIYFLLPPSCLSTLFTCFLVMSLGWWLIAFYLVITYPVSSSLWQKSNALKILFGIFTLFPFFCAMIVMRSYQEYSHPQAGAILLLYIMVLVWSTDSGAYAIGRLYGKQKLLPLVSPGKTVEGFLGGFIAALIVTLIFSLLSPLTVPTITLLISSIIAALFSVLGDLTESMFKREAKIKDSSHLIPGHGGILDRIDSLTAAIPIFACLALIIL